MREEFLNVWVLENEEAEARVGCRIETREKLHHWPLSWVEKWTLSDGRTVVYKSQRAEASVEKAVYEKVQAPFLLPLLHAETCRGCDMLIFPYCPSSPAAPPSEPPEPGLLPQPASEPAAIAAANTIHTTLFFI